MKSHAWKLVLLVSSAALAGVSTDPGSWDLYKGTAKDSSYVTEAECIAAAAKKAGKYGCRTITTVYVTVDPVPEPPVVVPPVIPPVKPDRPTDATTGPKGTLTKRAGFTISSPGVYENFEASGPVIVKASNVTVRNFKVITTSDNCIRVEEGLSNVLLEDGECDGARSSGVTGENFTARRLHVHNMGSDAFHLNDGGNVTILASYITKLGYNANAHADGVQIANGKNVTIVGNNFDMPANDPKYKNSQIFMIKPDFGPISNVRIEGNWLNGGGYSVNMAGTSTNVQIRNNVFGKDYSFGPLRLSAGVHTCGNTWADGSLLTQNAKCQ